jgi:hypothetical protein
MRAESNRARARERFAREPWHVCWWTTGRRRRTRREGYAVKAESERNVSGTPLANFRTHMEAQEFCDAHNHTLARAGNRP